MTTPNKSISNSSKELLHADDSAATLLVEVLQGTPGRNFDIESIFVEKLESGEWRWVVYEFLKADTVPPALSHPNYYWHKNKRKFLSLWTLVHALRKAGYHADLILVNYADDRNKSVKEMQVLDIKLNSEKIFRAACERDGKKYDEIKDHVVTKDSIMSFEKWKNKFREFNDKKKGDTWDLLESVFNEFPQTASESLPITNGPICEKCLKAFVPRKNGAKLCIECWKISR